MDLDDFIAKGSLNRQINNPAAVVVFLYLLYASRRAQVQASYQRIAEATGLSKRTVQRAVEALKQARLIKASLEHRTAEPVYTLFRPWAKK